MDLNATIQQLREERVLIEQVIASLEELQRMSEQDVPLPGASRRGRKSMPEEERQVLSARMKKYWASCRNGSEAREEHNWRNPKVRSDASFAFNGRRRRFRDCALGR